MAIVLTEALVMLLMTVAKTAMSEAIFWAEGKSDDEIKQRAASEEARTEELMLRMRRGDNG